MVATEARELTRREREVLELVARGHSNKEIGAILGITTMTASTHLSRIYGKLGVSGRVAALRKMQRIR